MTNPIVVLVIGHWSLKKDHCFKCFFCEDGDTQLGGFFQFARPHIVACYYIAGLGGDGRTYFASVAFY